MKLGLFAVLVASLVLVGCGEKQEESIAPDASALKAAPPKAEPPKGSGGIPAPTASGLDPTK